MTDQIDQITDTDVEEIDADAPARNKRRMFIAGAGLAGAAAIVGKSGTASAADGENVVVGGTYDGNTPTSFNNDTVGPFSPATPGTPGTEALVGDIEDPANPSHAIRGNTNGIGHAIAGTVPEGNANNSVAATWGKHDNGLGAGVGGVNGATGVDIAGPARGVEGLVLDATNGSHAVYGETAGGGHSVAGDTPADAAGPGGVGPNTTAATWGRHGGIGAGIGGVSAEGYGGEFIGGRSSVRLIPQPDAEAGAPSDDGHLRGELYVDGDGNLWYNTADGNNWVPLNQGGNGGTVLWENPQRASDTRPGSTPPNTDKTKYAPGETREIDLSALTDYPASATAALINLTVVNTEGERGFATVFNGDTEDSERPNTSNINWNSFTEVIANSATVRPSAEGVIKVYTSEATNVIIDVQGYIA